MEIIIAMGANPECFEAMQPFPVLRFENQNDAHAFVDSGVGFARSPRLWLKLMFGRYPADEPIDIPMNDETLQRAVPKIEREMAKMENVGSPFWADKTRGFLNALLEYQLSGIPTIEDDLDNPYS